MPPSAMRTYVMGNHSFYAAGNPEPKDIIPRASPSRPSSMILQSPPISLEAGSDYGFGVGAATQPTSAISALRSLTVRPPSPPSPTGSSTGIWPFSRSAANSPSTSYARPTANFFSSTYDGGYGGLADRPLPSRRPGAYARPKSIELVTPMVGR